MKLQDFDFRVWDKDEKCFLDPYTKSRAVVKNLPNEKLLNYHCTLIIIFSTIIVNTLFQKWLTYLIYFILNFLKLFTGQKLIFILFYFK